VSQNGEVLDEDKVSKLSLVDAITQHSSVKLRQSQANSSDLMNSHSLIENSAKDGSLEQSSKDDGGWLGILQVGVVGLSFLVPFLFLAQTVQTANAVPFFLFFLFIVLAELPF